MERDGLASLGDGKDLWCDAQIDTVVQFIVPDFAADIFLPLDTVLAGLVVGQWSRACLDAILSDLRKLIDWLFVTLQR